MGDGRGFAPEVCCSPCLSVLCSEISECSAAIDRSLKAKPAIIRSLAARAVSHPPRLILTAGHGSSAHALAFAAAAIKGYRWRSMAL